MFQPHAYISYLLNYEGPGSLLSKLKANSWANSLSAGGNYVVNGISCSTLFTSLTEEGFKRVDDVITLIYQYINMMKEEGPQQRIMEESRDLRAINFKFKDDDDPLPIVTEAASILGMCPLEETISGPRLWKRFEPELTQMLMDNLTPENMSSFVVSKTFAEKADQKEKWYGVEYSVEQHDLELEATWSSPEPNECFKLPEPNKFIPSNFDICERDTEATEYPRIIKDTALCRCWFKQENEFHLPKGYIDIAITCPIADISPLNENLTSLFVRLFNDMHREKFYDAGLASLTYELAHTGYGLRLSVEGYTHKLPLLLESVLLELTTFRVNEKRLAIFKEEMMRCLKNFSMGQPTSHAQYWLDLLLMDGDWTVGELLESEDDLSVQNVTLLASQLLTNIHIEMLVYGNFTQSSADQLSELVVTSLTTNRKCKPLPLSLQSRTGRAVELPDDSSYIYTGYNDVHSSSCVYVYLQVGADETHLNSLLMLLVHIIKDSCFTTLRTNEQLGYIVGAGIDWSCGVQGLLIVVESEKHPQYVSHRIEHFISSIQELLENLSPSEYEEYVSGLTSIKSTKSKNMGAKNGNYWGQVWTGNYYFNRSEVETEHIKTVTKSQLIDFYKEYIASDGRKRRKLSVHIKSKQHRDEFKPDDGDANGLNTSEKVKEATAVSSHIDFKRGLRLFPLQRASIELPKHDGSKL